MTSMQGHKLCNCLLHNQWCGFVTFSSFSVSKLVISLMQLPDYYEERERERERERAGKCTQNADSK